MSGKTPFHQHIQFPLLVAILSRKHNHHLILHHTFSSKISPLFLAALSHHLQQETIPHSLQGAELVNLPTARDFQKIQDILNTTDKCQLIVVSNTNELFLISQLDIFLSHPLCRFLVLNNGTKSKQHHHLDDYFTTVKINELTEADSMALLKQQCMELEKFHQVRIPEDVVTLAYALAGRYLSTDDTLEQALLLVDSSAAHTHSMESITSNTLITVLSHLTQIPASHLPLHRFKSSEFVQSMQQHVFGQEAAISILNHELQQSLLPLRENSGPFCRFLFSGPLHSGKKMAAIALTDYLFKQPKLFYFAQLTSATLLSLTKIKLQRHCDKLYFPLTDVIRQTPHAIIMLENIDQAPPVIIEELSNMLSTGHLYDDSGNLYNFRQSILILSSSLGTNRLRELTHAFESEDQAPEGGLMQMMLAKHHASAATHPYSADELVSEIMPEISTRLKSLYHHVRLSLFLPLTKTAIENILCLKLDVASNMLNSRYGIELDYAPEVLHYLTNETRMTDINQALRTLHFTLTQSVLGRMENKPLSHSLFLQLNETGQMLKYE